MNKFEEIRMQDKEINEEVSQPETIVEIEREGGEKIIESITTIKGGLGKDLEIFYSIIKEKYSDPDAGWTPSKLETVSTEKLRPIIHELRRVLNNGGAAEPDALIQVLIEEAQIYASKGVMKHDFLDRITSLDKIPTDSKLAKFNKFVTKGLE